MSLSNSKIERIKGFTLLKGGKVYDPFIARGLDALNYACYQDARFILAGTPSGISLAPEGGAHQSISTPLIGMGQPGLTYFEPAYADELSEIMLWAFNYMQEEDGGSVYLRLSTKTIIQPIRAMTPHLKTEVIQGAYWKKEPTPDSLLSIVYCGAIAGEAEEAHKVISEDLPGTGLLAITSPDQLYSDWQQTQTKRLSGKTDASSHIETLLHKLNPGAALITVIDGHPATLSWLAGVSGHKPILLGIEGYAGPGAETEAVRHAGQGITAGLTANIIKPRVA